MWLLSLLNLGTIKNMFVSKTASSEAIMRLLELYHLCADNMGRFLNVFFPLEMLK